MVYERATADDIKDLTALRIEFLLEDYGQLPQETTDLIAGRLPDYFRSHLNRDLFAFVCRADKGIAGCCFLYVSEKPPNPSFINGRTGTVMNVYTRPEFRRQGIAFELMKMLLCESEKLGLDFVELKATEDGYGLYRRLGFENAVSKYRDMKYIIDGSNRI